MQYIKVTLPAAEQSERDMLMALLSDMGYSGFEDTDDALLAFIEEPSFDREALSAAPVIEATGYKTEVIPAQNWNALWESNFQPVVVADFCTLRAHFHDIEVTTPYDIVITPKMSFGTGHHATTRLMITLMRGLDFKGKRVLDFGTGTGVLAILAEKLGAADVLAIDNDEWPVENTIENAARNNCAHIRAQLASLEDIETAHVGVLLANINRHILLQHMEAMYKTVAAGGHLLLSGILREDRAAILLAATNAGFKYVDAREEGDWLAMHLEKP